MNYQSIIFEKKEAVCTISLNRPKVYHALNNQLCDDLIAGLSTAAMDEEIRVIIITASGKAFCSGQDLKSKDIFEAGSYSEVLQRNYIPLINTIRNMPKPVICKLNGIAAGAGCSLALACDLIIAREDAVLTEIFIGIGLVPDAGSSYFLTQLLSRTKAFELATQGTRVTAKEAENLGIVNKAVPANQLDEAVQEAIAYYSEAPTKAIGMIKELLNQSYHKNLNQMMELEAKYQDIASHTEDHKEGIKAFIEKRKPKFTGK